MHHARYEDDTDRQTLLSLVGKSAEEVKEIFEGDPQPAQKPERRHVTEDLTDLNRHERRKAAKLSRSPRGAGASRNTPAKP